MYAILVVLHVLSVVIWLGFLPADLLMRNQISKTRGKKGEFELISAYLKLSNLTGIIGLLGVLISGILLVTTLPYYQFFNFSNNHWLATKQVIMVIILLIVFLMLIPRSKQLRQVIETRYDSSLPESETNKLNKVYNSTTIINILVLINFLLGITHRFF